jgi:hypothetical protein
MPYNPMRAPRWFRVGLGAYHRALKRSQEDSLSNQLLGVGMKLYLGLFVLLLIKAIWVILTSSSP